MSEPMFTMNRFEKATSNTEDELVEKMIEMYAMLTYLVDKNLILYSGMVNMDDNDEFAKM